MRVNSILTNNYADGVHHTHVSMIKPNGRFKFSGRELSGLWDVYCGCVFTDKNCKIGLAEKSENFIPIMADVDIKLELDDSFTYGDHLYSDIHVKQVIHVYQSVIRDVVDDLNDSNLTCMLLEKPIYYPVNGKVKYIKNGFHLHFPNLFINKTEIDIHIIPRVRDEIKKLDVFKDIGVSDSSSVIDKAVCSVPWLLYGSRKDESMEPYRFSKMFDSGGNEVGLDILKDHVIYDHDEQPIKFVEPLEYYLPRILSIRPYNRLTHFLKQGLSLDKLKEKITHKRARKQLSASSEEELALATRILPMIADFRAEDRNEWLTIGWVLYNVGDGSLEALNLWLEFSSRCGDKYDESDCISKWDRMTKQDLTLGTLKYFASIDSPEAYTELKQERTENHLNDSLNGSHNDIAKVLYSEYGGEFVCASISGNTWFQFIGDKWEEIEEGVFLRQKISETIVKRYGKKGAAVFQKMSEVTDKAELEMYKARSKQIQNIICNLKNAGFKNNIMKEAKEVFYDRRFKNKLDQNPNIIGFNNGVYDLISNEFREGRPEDFVSKTMPIDYKVYNMFDDKVQDVKDFLIKVFPDESIRDYFLDIYSDLFMGGNTEKKVYMWTGEGDNAKSITQKFFELLFGELAIKFNTQYFTGKKAASGAANPELARGAPPVRHATMEEPDADEQLNIGELKKLSGGDSYWARDLFEKGKNTREVFPMFTLTFICNKLPKLKYSDKATWNRIRVIPFESTFVAAGHECPSTLQEQIKQKRFPMDKEFSKKIPGLVSAFAWYLLEWRKNRTIKHIPPSKVMKATSVYRQQNDIYKQYIEECIVDDETCNPLSLSELYISFKEWYKDGFPGSTLPFKNEVKEYFEIAWGPPTRGNKWAHRRIKTEREEEEGSIMLM